jgi:hypothetical protein
LCYLLAVTIKTIINGASKKTYQVTSAFFLDSNLSNLTHSASVKLCDSPFNFGTISNAERSKLAREKQLREEVEREKAALEARLIQYQEEVGNLFQSCGGPELSF